MSAPFDFNGELQRIADGFNARLTEAQNVIAELGQIAQDFQATLNNVNAQVTALAPSIAALPKLIADLDTKINNFRVL